MKDLLTVELLSDVLGYEVKDFGLCNIHYIGITQNKDYVWVQVNDYGKHIHLDTLTRLSLEYIESKGYIYNLFNSTSVQGYVMIINEHKIIGKSMLEAVLQATEWVRNNKMVKGE